MAIFLLVIIFAFISLGLIIYAKSQAQYYSSYETYLIKGAVRGHLGGFDYKSTVESKRKRLSSSNSKF